jgi:hypothetical protein
VWWHQSEEYRGVRAGDCDGGMPEQHTPEFFAGTHSVAHVLEALVSVLCPQPRRVLVADRVEPCPRRMCGTLLAQTYMCVMAVFISVATAKDPFTRMAAPFARPVSWLPGNNARALPPVLSKRPTLFCRHRE